MAVTVRVKLKDTTLAEDPVVGVNVRFYTDADVFVTEGTTDVLGIVDVDLPGGAYPDGVEYHVRGYKLGVAFGAPRTIEVYEPAEAAPNNNDFTWSVNVFEIENSPTPGLCRVSGKLIRADGTVATDQRLLFKAWPVETPNVFYDHLVVPQAPPLGELPAALTTRSDSLGVFRIDLLRGGKYTVIVPGWDEEFRQVLVPDRAGVLLADLIFPIPAQVTYDPVGPFSLMLGTPQTIGVSVVFSDYNDYGAGGDYVEFSSSDTGVFTVALSGSDLILTPVAAGSAELQATRTSSVFAVKPERAFTGDTVAVTVA